MLMPRMIAVILSVMAMALMNVDVASAAPTRNAEPLVIAYDNNETYTIVVPGRGTFTPGIIIEGDGVALIPVAFTDTVTFEDSSDFTESTEKNGKRKGMSDDLVTCTYGGTFEFNGQTVVFEGTVTPFLLPRGSDAPPVR